MVVAAIAIAHRFPNAACILLLAATLSLLGKPSRAGVVGAIVGLLVATLFCVAEVTGGISPLTAFPSSFALSLWLFLPWLGIGATFGAFVGQIVGDLIQAIRVFRDEKHRGLDEFSGTLEPLAAERTACQCQTGERPCCQFTLRALLMVMLLASIVMAWVAPRIQKMGNQRAAMELVERLGGTYRFGTVDLRGTKVTDSDMSCLANLQSVRSLCLSGTRISDAGVVHLQDFPELEQLSLADTRISDAGLAHLRHLHNLERLNLSGTCINGGGLRHAAGLNRLRTLTLTGTNIEDQYLRELPDLPELRELFLSETKISDSGLAQLRTYPKLQSIALERTSVTRNGFAALRERMPGLRWRVNPKGKP